MASIAAWKLELAGRLFGVRGLFAGGAWPLRLFGPRRALRAARRLMSTPMDRAIAAFRPPSEGQRRATVGKELPATAAAIPGLDRRLGDPPERPLAPIERWDRCVEDRRVYPTLAIL